VSDADDIREVLTDEQLAAITELADSELPVAEYAERIAEEL